MRSVEADRTPSNDQHPSLAGIEARQLDWYGPTVRQPSGMLSDSEATVTGRRRWQRDQHRVGVGHRHQIGEEAAAVESGDGRHPVHRHQRSDAQEPSHHRRQAEQRSAV